MNPSFSSGAHFSDRVGETFAGAIQDGDGQDKTSARMPDFSTGIYARTADSKVALRAFDEDVIAFLACFRRQQPMDERVESHVRHVRDPLAADHGAMDNTGIWQHVFCTLTESKIKG